MNISRRTALLGAAGAAGTAGLVAVASGANSSNVASPVPTDSNPGPLPQYREKVNLVTPPHVHPHQQVANRPPVIKEFRLTVDEKKIVVDEEGTKMHAMTYNGWIPGPLMVVHEGDYIELTLVNPDNQRRWRTTSTSTLRPGRSAAAALTLVNPGEQAMLRFKATRPGVFVYHCAPGGPMIPWHVVSGMNGAVMVLPRDGLKDADGKPLRYDRIYLCRRERFLLPRDDKGKFKTYESLGDAYPDVEQTHARPDPLARRVQRQGRFAHRQERDDRQGRRDGADRPLARPTATPVRT